MESTYYWINKCKLGADLASYLPTFTGTAWGGTSDQGALFCFDARPVEALADDLKLENGLNAAQINAMLVSGYKPVPYRLMPELVVSDNGKISFTWPQETNQAIYPLQLQAGPVRSFFILMTRVNPYASVDPNLSARAYVFFAGTVGGKDSGADLELEEISEYEVGGALFMENNSIDMPFFIHQPHVDKSTHPQALSLPGTNGMTTEDYQGVNNSGKLHSGAQRGISTPPYSAFQRSLWLSSALNGHLQVNFETIQRSISGVYIAGQIDLRNRCPKKIEFICIDAQGVWHSVHTFVIQGTRGIETLYLPEPVKNVKGVRLKFNDVLNPDSHRNSHGPGRIFTRTIGISDIRVLGVV
ncbi:hypothetical protein [Pseudoalteromonas peptidolytica]|uniref:hypothetical protein n=1 Tax=Pseudoalteromonas peptidolytica TaxID=61150 RepID=UPI00298E7AC2|nr:hypothetical protein [Pseudoalteromonas peptidolytica]MDW7551356.1 hypothetical protein [Pseudoalteromonas peptidolytica]